MAEKKTEETVRGRWPVAVYDHTGKRVEPGEPATLADAKAAEFDARFGRLPDEPLASPDKRRVINADTP